MAIGIFVPIILILGVLIVLYMIQRYANLRGIRVVAGAYISILVVSCIIYYFLPNTKFIDESLLNTEIENEFEEHSDIYEAALQGTIDKHKDVTLVHEWKFPYTDTELDISKLDTVPMYVVFEKKENDDQQIEVLYYATNTSWLGIDLMNKINLPQLSIEKDRFLYLEENEHNDNADLKFTNFTKDFVVSQFKGGGVIDGHEQFGSLNRPFDSEVLYIRIPKNLQLIGSDYINFVGNEN